VGIIESMSFIDPSWYGRITRGSSTLIGPSRQAVQRLVQDPAALSHLLDPHEIAVVAVAVLPDRDVEVVRLVVVVGRSFRTSYGTPEARRLGR
jgi:hypothetical protein